MNPTFKDIIKLSDGQEDTEGVNNTKLIIIFYLMKL